MPVTHAFPSLQANLLLPVQPQNCCITVYKRHMATL